MTGVAVVTHSSGNHAQAVAMAARLCGVPAHIVMPESSPAVKTAAVREYGGIVTFCESTEQVCVCVCGCGCPPPLPLPPQARVETAASVMERVGPRALMVPSSNHPDIMAGQGTIATEFLQQVYRDRVQRVMLLEDT